MLCCLLSQIHVLEDTVDMFYFAYCFYFNFSIRTLLFSAEDNLPLISVSEHGFSDMVHPVNESSTSIVKGPGFYRSVGFFS